MPFVTYNKYNVKIPEGVLGLSRIPNHIKDEILEGCECDVYALPSGITRKYLPGKTKVVKEYLRGVAEDDLHEWAELNRFKVIHAGEQTDYYFDKYEVMLEASGFMDDNNCHSDFKRTAKFLNLKGYTTVLNNVWTGENLRIFMNKWEDAQLEESC